MQLMVNIAYLKLNPSSNDGENNTEPVFFRRERFLSDDLTEVKPKNRKTSLER
jgi:hypothetical protein